MFNSKVEQMSIEQSQETHLLTQVEAFLRDRRAQGMSRHTIKYYRNALKLFCDFCETQAITQVTQIVPGDIRTYLLWLAETGHNEGGVHLGFRTLRTFLYWWENETEPDNWHNPVRKIKAPHLPQEPLNPVNLDDVRAMVDTCERGCFTGDRDKAILLGLLDTGARASEFVAINLGDINQLTGEILIRQGKGRKPRVVFLGAKSRKAMRVYLRHRPDALRVPGVALWVTDDGERLSYWGLRDMLHRRSQLAGVKEPTIHSFRRAFALLMLRAGVDLLSIQLLLGHSDLQTIRRYIKQLPGDIQEAHRRGSPVDANW